MLENVDQHEATIDPDGRVTIPKALLERWGWVPGTKLLVEETDDGVLVTTG
ncbi:AbrB/MazE/SpoVT family DNA-binding domain-containing protein [Lichenicoccus sp.]|uniref:AbrB/MazE/SpoVT family DNA-binding domain-containing protein n=1 Tax=Lichenicoccus sp. TaxID=2781899 RepID=UPI003D14D034